MPAPEPFPYDRASKWLIGHHGDAILRLAGLTDIESWRAVQAEVVQPRRLPDGLLEVRRAGQDKTDLFVIEIATDPERRVAEQLLGDAALVYLNRGVLPEVVVVVLRRKGRLRVPRRLDLSSPAGWTRWRASWRVVELWSIPAADLLAPQDPGLAPWATVARWTGRPEELLRQCRDLIDRKAAPDEYRNMLGVAVALAGIRYNQARLLDILGGEQAMIDSPALNRVIAKQFALKMHPIILNVLKDRLGDVPPEIEAAVRTIQDEDLLDRANRLAARTADYPAFRRDLEELRPPSPPPRRGRKRD
jgi:hypothetical protein